MSYGDGRIKRYVTRSGRERFHVQLPNGKGGYLPGGTYDSAEEAEGVRAAALNELRTSTHVRSSFAEFGDIWLQRIAKQRSVSGSRSRWITHVAPTELGQLPTEDVQPSHVRDFVRALPHRVSPKTGKVISVQTCRHIWSLVRRCLAEAVTDTILAADPSAGIKAAFGKRKRSWTYLKPAEIAAVLALPDLSEEQRAVIQVATYQGLRQGELAALQWEDLDLEAAKPRMAVTRSWDRPATKNGEHRVIAVIPPAVAVLRAWRDRSGRRTGLVFPGPSGAMYALGYDWRWGERRGNCLDIPTRAGIARRVTFHALRHTCGSGLVNGFWGDPWGLPVVRDFLGHSSVSMTERYAHLEDAAMDAAAASTLGAPRDPESDLESIAKQVADRVSELLGMVEQSKAEPDQARLGISCPGDLSVPADLAPRFQVHARSVAVRVLEAAERGEQPLVADVRQLARAVIGADPATTLAVRLLIQPGSKMRATDVLELAAIVAGKEAPAKSATP